jgi:hypothetical protein
MHRCFIGIGVQVVMAPGGRGHSVPRIGHEWHEARASGSGQAQSGKQRLGGHRPPLQYGHFGNYARRGARTA